MLAKIAPASNDFHALARYLVRGKSKIPDPTRVAWIASQNLPTDDPELAATYMTATADRSRRTKNAAYHVMIAWHERERPSVELMQTVATQTLELAGLAEHQALIMGHGDKPHAHLHILLNRVNPETGRAWKTAHDFARFDRIMRDLSGQHGCEYVPAHAFNPELTDDRPIKPNSAATYAAKHGAPTDRLKWSKASARAIGKRVSEDLGPASTLEDLEAALAAEGLALEPKGKGLVAGTPTSYATLSSMGLTATAKNMRRLRGPFRPRRIDRPLLDVDAIDIVKVLYGLGLAGRDEIQEVVAEAARERLQRLAAASFSRQLSAQLGEALKTTTSLKPAKAQRPRSAKPKLPNARAPASPSR